jgi:aryl-alcohol dehydrogenase-like predicted oxidoreductase
VIFLGLKKTTPAKMEQRMLPTTSFGITNQQVTVAGLGGEGVLRTFGQREKAAAVIQEALDRGITYFDSARVYSDSEVYYGSVWGERQDARLKIFQTSKSASRDKKGALADLEQTLKRLRTDYLDLWQIHDVRTEEEVEEIAGPGGALEAFIEARLSGKVRYIGVTGHHDPRVLARAVREWPVDSVMLPVNPVETLLGGFMTLTLPVAKEKGIAVIGMKILGGAHYLIKQLGITPESLIRYSLAQDITVGIVGCSTLGEVKTLAEKGSNPHPMTEKEKSALLEKFEPYAERLAFYRGPI